MSIRIELVPNPNSKNRVKLKWYDNSTKGFRTVKDGKIEVPKGQIEEIRAYVNNHCDESTHFDVTCYSHHSSGNIRRVRRSKYGLAGGPSLMSFYNRQEPIDVTVGQNDGILRVEYVQDSPKRKTILPRKSPKSEV